MKYGSDGYLPDRSVKRRIRADIERVAAEGISGLGFKGFATFKSHSPYSLVVSPRQIRHGFYDSLQSLQGHRQTYYAGAAFQTHSSAAIWAQLEELVAHDDRLTSLTEVREGALAPHVLHASNNKTTFRLRPRAVHSRGDDFESSLPHLRSPIS